MGRFGGFLIRLRSTMRAGEAERDMDDELNFHLEMQAASYRRDGVLPQEAWRRAIIAFGGLEKHREALRDGRRVPVVEGVLRDIRFALRSLSRSRLFTVVAVLTLGLGIGGSTTVFGVVDALFLRPPPGVAQPAEVVQLRIVRTQGVVRTGPAGGGGSYHDFEAIRGGAGAFAGLAASLSPTRLDVGLGIDAEPIVGTAVSAEYFQVLGVPAAAGRFFGEWEDSVPGAYPVAVISERLWSRRFGRDPAIAGREMMINGRSLTVIGVAGGRFAGLSSEAADVWVPMAMASELGLVRASGDWRQGPFVRGVSVVARLAPGAAVDQAERDAAAVLPRGELNGLELDPTPRIIAASLIPGRAPDRPRAAQLSLLLAGVAAMVLLIACANVANLLLARGTSRTREFAVRASLGAGRARIIRQLLTESVVLASLGGLAGAGVAGLGSAIVGAFPLPHGAGELNLRLLFFGIGATLVSAMIFGALPALRLSSWDPGAALKGARAGGVERARLRRGLLAGQICLSLVLLVGAGLFVRSLLQVHAVNPGIDTERLVVVSADLERAGFTASQRRTFFELALERVAEMPGVERASIAHMQPLGGSSISLLFNRFDGEPLPFDDAPFVNWVAPGYFETVGTPILSGRPIVDSDRPGSERVAVVNERMVQMLAPGGNVVGECLRQPHLPDCIRIVGVSGDSRRHYLDEDPAPMVYLVADDSEPLAAPPLLLVRTRVGAPATPVEIRAALQTLQPDLPYVSVEPFESLYGEEIVSFRMGAVLFTIFGLLALLVAIVGTYGMVNYTVSERTREIGIRMALGAPTRAVVGSTVRQGMVPIVFGGAAGLIITLLAAPLVEPMLFGVAPRDLITYAAMVGVLMGTSFAATLLPAVRASRVDPMVALTDP